MGIRSRTGGSNGRISFTAEQDGYAFHRTLVDCGQSHDGWSPYSRPFFRIASETARRPSILAPDWIHDAPRGQSTLCRRPCAGLAAHRSHPGRKFLQEIGGARHRQTKGLVRQPCYKRRRRDSNPRYGHPYTGFQNQRLQPLGHSSSTPKPRPQVAKRETARHRVSLSAGLVGTLPQTIAGFQMGILGLDWLAAAIGFRLD